MADVFVALVTRTGGDPRMGNVAYTAKTYDYLIPVTGVVRTFINLGSYNTAGEAQIACSRKHGNTLFKWVREDMNHIESWKGYWCNVTP